MLAGDTTGVVRAAQCGDREAAGRMVERFSPWLMAQARLRLRGPLASLCSPEDLVQDTWLVALSRLGDLRWRDGRLTPVLVRFLATTLRRRLRDAVESALRVRSYERPSEGVSSQFEATVTAGLAAASWRERAERLWAAIGTLPERDRHLVVLRGLEGLPFDAVGRLLGLPASAATSAWARTRQRLRTLLDEELADDLQP